MCDREINQRQEQEAVAQHIITTLVQKPPAPGPLSSCDSSLQDTLLFLLLIILPPHSKLWH